MQYIYQEPRRFYAWLTLALFAGVVVILGVVLFAQPAGQQLAQSESPLPVEQVMPPITQPAVQ